MTSEANRNPDPSEALEMLRRYEAILDAVCFAAERFLRSATWEDAVQPVLERLCRATGVRRATVFHGTSADMATAEVAAVLTWRASDAAPAGAGTALGDVAPAPAWPKSDGAGWRARMADGQVVLADATSGCDEERRFLQARGIVCAAVAPVFVGGTWWGFISFEDCERRRPWHTAELDAFRAAASAMGTSIERQARDTSMRQLATAIQQAAEAIIVTDAAGTICYVNPAFERITGYTAATALGKTPRLLRSGKHDAGFYREMWETISGGRTWAGRIVNRRSDGTLYEDETTISPVRDDAGRITHYVSVKRDVTKEVRLEELLRRAQRMEGLGMLAGGVAHDFGNVLTPIMAYSEMSLAVLDKGGKAYEYISQVHQAAGRAETLVRQLLSFSRKQTPEFRVVNVNDVVLGFRKMLERAVRENIALNVALDPSAGRIRADASQIEQILMNLAVNARDAMPDAGRLTIETRRVHLDGETPMEVGVSARGDYAVLSVTDTGCGMDAETRSQIFDPFFTTKPAGEGTGLGLATVYGIVKQHGANIEVVSEVGHGTCIRVYFASVAEAPEKSDAASRPEQKLRGSETVMVVEDDANVRALAGEILRRHGYEVVDFEDPARALRFARQMEGPIHLLLTDVIMPRMNGRELYLRLAAFRADMKVVYMSGYTGNVIGRYGVLDSSVHFLKKPFSVQSLTREVRNALDS